LKNLKISQGLKKTPLRKVRKKPYYDGHFRHLKCKRKQGSRLIGDTFPLHFLLAIKLSCVILTGSQ
jgi:hypothetical protein